MQYKPVFTYKDTKVYCHLCQLTIFFKTGQGKAGHVRHAHFDKTIITKREGGHVVYYYGDS